MVVAGCVQRKVFLFFLHRPDNVQSSRCGETHLAAVRSEADKASERNSDQESAWEVETQAEKRHDSEAQCQDMTVSMTLG